GAALYTWLLVLSKSGWVVGLGYSCHPLPRLSMTALLLNNPQGLCFILFSFTTLVSSVGSSVGWASGREGEWGVLFFPLVSGQRMDGRMGGRPDRMDGYLKGRVNMASNLEFELEAAAQDSLFLV
ncbi:hypothetical protein BC567DRAFT_221539, partial [Phyllosticta citribraziliensis]